MVRIQEKTKEKNTSHVLDMTSENPYSLMLRFTMPIFFSQVFQQLYNTADAFIVGRYLGTNALAAVTSSGNLIFLMVSFFMGMGMGGGVVISRYFGAKDGKQVSRSVHTMMAFGIVCGLILTVIGVAFTPTFLAWMRTDPEVMPEAVEYFRYYFLGALAVVLYNVCCSIMNAVGNGKRPLYYLIFSSLVNILLDLLFIGGFRWGVWAAALATVISQAASVVLCMFYLLHEGNIYTVELRKIRFHKDILFEVINYGLPSGVQNSVIAFANVIVQSQINSFGRLAMAGYGVHAKIEGFVFLPVNSFNMAVTTFISQNLGAKQYDRAKKGARFSILTAAITAEVIGLFYYIFAPLLIGLFDKTPGVIEYGMMQARIVALFYFLLAFSHSVAAVCRGAGKAIVPMFIMLIVWCGVRITYIIIVMKLFGEIRYVFWAYPLTWSISAVIYLVYYLFSDWVHGFEHKKKI